MSNQWLVVVVSSSVVDLVFKRLKVYSISQGPSKAVLVPRVDVGNKNTSFNKRIVLQLTFKIYHLNIYKSQLFLSHHFCDNFADHNGNAMSTPSQFLNNGH